MSAQASLLDLVFMNKDKFVNSLQYLPLLGFEFSIAAKKCG